eukprot:CAMPEP_0170541816 /NCGR_PEP_ID=MMETSP0211-20121228/1442_1 /TAXON_ID=311385 /ORGANISM="Pseudokeronopsis sp., Strain OXSARD2" /LENGTH=41 /DNA_ID= /DNA_START= /DNA_END= /DNA_ORIENTATION=
MEEPHDSLQVEVEERSDSNEDKFTNTFAMIENKISQFGKLA